VQSAFNPEEHEFAHLIIRFAVQTVPNDQPPLIGIALKDGECRRHKCDQYHYGVFNRLSATKATRTTAPRQRSLYDLYEMCGSVA
jgi:hypothetical protein